jgi:hypothetical protein
MLKRGFTSDAFAELGTFGPLELTCITVGALTGPRVALEGIRLAGRRCCRGAGGRRADPSARGWCA